MKRIDFPEKMDSESLPVGKLREALDFLSFTNRRFGGNDLVLRYLAEFLQKTGKRSFTLLDVGCGNGDMLKAIAQWSEKQGLKSELVGLELVPDIAAIGQDQTKSRSNISVLNTDIFSFEPTNRYDYVVASLFLHHVPGSKLEFLMKKLDAVTADGMIISDLRRSVAGYCAVTLASFLFGNEVVRHDGPLSVRRSFTVEELARLAERAALRYLRARNEPFFRVSLRGQKRDAP